MSDAPPVTLLPGDARAVLATLPDESAHCSVTSPPYWGLRNYGVAGQLGLEPTPEAYVAALVAVFREVRRVLRRDGTLWLNLGDSYTAGGGNGGAGITAQAGNTKRNLTRSGSARPPPGLKPKDMVGIPWAVAFALRQPHYDGKINDERDRVWLAAIIDGEGCISLNRARAKEGVRNKDCFGTYLRVHNTNEAIVRRCAALAGCGTIKMHDTRRRSVFVWAVYGKQARQILREVYPYLVAKQREARLASGVRDVACYEALKMVHQGRLTDVDQSAPATCYTPGWYLRSDIIWAKKNCMPESVTDRPTKSHEHIFLLSKSQKYFYDAAAIREPASPTGDGNRREFRGGGSYVEGNSFFNDAKKPNRTPGNTGRTGKTAMRGQGHFRDGAGPTNRGGRDMADVDANADGARNKRDVWTVATAPYAEAHFATFPPELIKPCILAGCPVGGVVLDPFGGSGTTGAVALELGRRAILIELNPAYLELARARCNVTQGLPL